MGSDCCPREASLGLACEGRPGGRTKWSLDEQAKKTLSQSWGRGDLN